MRAIVRQKAAKNLSGMKVMELDVPRMGPQQLTIKMASARINPVDIDLMKGMPFLKYKKPQIGGIDGAGTILDMGSEVNGFQIGDEVFFYRAFTDIGTWAEQIVIDAQYVASIPQSLNLIQAGGIALPLLTAYESLIQMEPKRGESILIHAGAGGVGYQATQIALGMGLKVIATASDQDFGLLRGLGVEALIDYRSQDFSQILANQPPNYIFDLVGGEVLAKSISLQPKRLVSVNYPDVSKLHKTGIKIPSLLRGIMRLATSKYLRMAKRHSVELIGQVTGGNGKLLREATDFINRLPQYQIRESHTANLDFVEREGMQGLRHGTVLLFG